MKFIWIFGPQAVGKMTVGHELEKLTGLKLFHNHMTIDLVSPFFSYSTPTGKRLVKLFREEIFKEVANSDQKGLIFTYLLYYGDPDEAYVEKISNMFKEQGAEIYYVELEADLEERVKRNSSAHRLEHKPSKRDLVHSEKELRTSMETHRLNSRDGEIKWKNYFKINNTNLNAEEVAKIIVKKFML